MQDYFAEIVPALALALSAIVATGVLIVGIALVFKAIDTAAAVIGLTIGDPIRLKDREEVYFTAEEEAGFNEWLKRNQ